MIDNQKVAFESISRTVRECRTLCIKFYPYIPLAIFLVCAFGFAALWGKYIWLGIATVIFAIGHCTVTWNSYKQVNEHNVKMS